MQFQSILQVASSKLVVEKIGFLKCSSPAFTAKRKDTLCGRLVNNLKILNPMCRILQVPTCLAMATHDVLMDLNIERYQECDIACAFQTIRYGYDVQAWTSLQTVAKIYLTLRGCLGLASMPPIFCTAWYPAVQGIESNQAGGLQFYFALRDAICAEKKTKKDYSVPSFFRDQLKDLLLDAAFVDSLKKP